MKKIVVIIEKHLHLTGSFISASVSFFRCKCWISEEKKEEDKEEKADVSFFILFFAFCTFPEQCIDFFF